MEEKYAAEALENGINIPIKDIGETSPISFMEVMKDAKLTKMQEGVCKSIRTKMRNRVRPYLIIVSLSRNGLVFKLGRQPL